MFHVGYAALSYVLWVLTEPFAATRINGTTYARIEWCRPNSYVPLIVAISLTPAQEFKLGSEYWFLYMTTFAIIGVVDFLVTPNLQTSNERTSAEKP